MLAVWNRFLWDDEGADLIEYALLVSLVAIGGATVLSEFIVGVGGLLDTIIDTLESFVS